MSDSVGQLALTSLNLSHFRSHKRLSIEIDARPLALFGRNGAGKTNILEAVSLFSPGRGLRRASAEDMTRRPEAVGWTVNGVLQTNARPREIKMQSKAGAARQLWLEGKSAPQVSLGAFSRVLWLVPSMDRLWIEGADGRRRFLDRMALSFWPDHAEASITYEKAMRERNRLLKDQVQDPNWYGALEAQMASAGCRVMQARRDALNQIAKAQEGAQTAFPAANLSLEHPDADLPRDPEGLARALADNRMRDLAAGRTLIGPHRVDLIGHYAEKGVPARDCSTGEQKALLISLILSNARALKDKVGTPPLVLLDEVAAHLDAGRRTALYDEICALGAQAWMTGTERDLFADLGGRAQYLEISENGASSHVAMHKI